MIFCRQTCRYPRAVRRVTSEEEDGVKGIGKRELDTSIARRRSDNLI